jgi:RNA polymerase sigma-70 factor (ECF subfamily)
MSGNQPRYAALEQRLKQAWMDGDLKGSAGTAVSEYGPELLGFLTARFRDRTAAAEAFAQGQEDFWTAWPSFRWDCPARNWMYKIFSNAANRWHRDRHNNPGLRAGLSGVGQAADQAQASHQSPAPYLRTTIKSRFRLLRDQLPEEERTLLILKVDKGFSWREVAEIMLPEAELSAEEWKREADRRAQQFSRLKQKLRQQLLDS